jgi:Fe-S-cluster containining protein
LHPEHGDDPDIYETVREGDAIMIAPRAQGTACRYLGAKGCTIYERRPYTCRLYDCRAHMAMTLAGLNGRHAAAKSPHRLSGARQRRGRQTMARQSGIVTA